MLHSLSPKALMAVLALVAGLATAPRTGLAATPQVNAVKEAQSTAPVAATRARKYQGSRGGAR